jgi:hypothetical protein
MGKSYEVEELDMLAGPYRSLEGMLARATWTDC